MPGNGVLPLLDVIEEDSAYIRRRGGKRHVYRVASRCQVSLIDMFFF